MRARKTAPTMALVADHFEVRDLLTGEVIGRISAQRLRQDGTLARALERHGFRLVGVSGREREADLRRNAA